MSAGARHTGSDRAGSDVAATAGDGIASDDVAGVCPCCGQPLP